MAAYDLLPVLRAHRAAWESRPGLRALYRHWYGLVERELAPGPAPTVELGCGIGTFKEFLPRCLATDVAPTPWSEQVVDAQSLPFDAGSVANLVLVDVLHHLPHPRSCLAEAERVLRPGGRMVLLEPYCSAISTPLYRAFHEERTSLGVDPFAPAPRSSERPFDANQALPTLIFWRHADRLRTLFPNLAVVRRRRLALLAYPLSGGFSKRPLLPASLLRAAQRLEPVLAPAAPLMAFRCLVTLERRAS